MRKSFVFFLWIFLLLFVVASLYISFTAYIKDRDRKVFSNVSTFFLRMSQGEEKIELPYPEYTVIVHMRKPEGKFLSANAVSSVDREAYELINLGRGRDVTYIYVKKIDPVDYLMFVSQNLLFMGLLVANILLYLSIFYFTVKELELAQGGGVPAELMNRLKALRLSLATFKVIPEESVKEMRKVVDDILKNRSSKR